MSNVDTNLNKLLNIKFKGLSDSYPKEVSVIKNIYGKFVVTLYPVWVATETKLIGESGIGDTFEEALQDYVNKITGKTLIIEENNTEYESEVV